MKELFKLLAILMLRLDLILGWTLLFKPHNSEVWDQSASSNPILLSNFIIKFYITPFGHFSYIQVYLKVSVAGVLFLEFSSSISSWLISLFPLRLHSNVTLKWDVSFHSIKITTPNLAPNDSTSILCLFAFIALLPFKTLNLLLIYWYLIYCPPSLKVEIFVHVCCYSSKPQHSA